MVNRLGRYHKAMFLKLLSIHEFNQTNFPMGENNIMVCFGQCRGIPK